MYVKRSVSYAERVTEIRPMTLHKSEPIEPALSVPENEDRQAVDKNQPMYLDTTTCNAIHDHVRPLVDEETHGTCAVDVIIDLYRCGYI